MGLLDGRLAIVTGGGGGIGGATTLALAAEAALVAVLDVDGEAAAAAADRINRAGGTATAYPVDVADEAAVAATVEEIRNRFGRIDILHNNAALTAADTLARDTTVTDTDLDVWNAMLAVNLTSQFLMCKHTIPVMLAGGRGGSVINMSSGAANIGDTTRVSYAVSKAGVHTLTRYVAATYGKQGIRCNAIIPGLVLTPAVEAQIPEELLAGLSDAALTPFVGSPGDVGDLVVFLASDRSRYLTGQLIPLDGGMSVGRGTR